MSSNENAGQLRIVISKSQRTLELYNGGEIMIHGGGAGSDWTAGCVAVDDGCMDYLWKFVVNGTEVEIQP